MEHVVLRMGHPELARVAEPVGAAAFGGIALASLVTDLWETMAARGGVGLAATQIWRLAAGGGFRHGVERSLP